MRMDKPEQNASILTGMRFYCVQGNSRAVVLGVALQWMTCRVGEPHPLAPGGAQGVVVGVVQAAAQEYP